MTNATKRNSKEVFYMNQFYDTNIQSTLSSAEAQVYGAYLRYSNGGKDKCWPGQDKLSANLGLHDRTISRALKKLQELGYIILVKRGNDKAGNSVYVVKTPFELGFSVHRDIEAEPTVDEIKGYGRDEKEDSIADIVKAESKGPIVDAQLVTLKEPVKVSKPEIPNKLSEQDIMKSFSELFSPAVTITPAESIDDEPVKELWEGNDIEMCQYDLEKLAKEVWELGQRTGRDEWKKYSLAMFYTYEVSTGRGTPGDRKRKQLKLRHDLQKELGLV